jgi:anti-anti-sigma factor
MPPPPQPSPLVVTQVGAVTVARVGHPLILSGETAEAVGDHLGRLAEDGQTQILLNCANVQSLTSLMIGRLIVFNRKVSAAGGGLALCDVRPDVRGVLDVIGLPHLIRVYATEQAALDDLGR